ncbi:MAG TPA: hypothetical protein VK694_04420 [Verrucomicrobiae bacterium]|nr:hypothetical protein [Verrucomicrobiae bacterium]
MSNLEAQIELLRTTGNQFSDEERHSRRLALPGVYLEGDDGPEPALYDSVIVPAIPYLIAPSEEVHEALEAIRPGRATDQNPDDFIEKTFNRKGVLIGFSGYGTGSDPIKKYEYSAEHDGLQALFAHCRTAGISIDGVIDGATGYGVPGLSGTLAEKQGLITTGFAPLESLRGAAMRHKYGVVGKVFGDEAQALGGTPDILVAMGGGPNAQKEIEAALDLGTLVILATLRGYPGNSIAHLPNRATEAKTAQDVEAARKAHIPVESTSVKHLLGIFDSLNMDRLRATRDQRAEHLARVLAPLP